MHEKNSKVLCDHSKQENHIVDSKDIRSTLRARILVKILVSLGISLVTSPLLTTTQRDRSFETRIINTSKYEVITFL
jgi:hypothetical protein